MPKSLKNKIICNILRVLIVLAILELKESTILSFLIVLFVMVDETWNCIHPRLICDAGILEKQKKLQHLKDSNRFIRIRANEVNYPLFSHSSFRYSRRNIKIVSILHSLRLLESLETKKISNILKILFVSAYFAILPHYLMTKLSYDFFSFRIKYLHSRY